MGSVIFDYCTIMSEIADSKTSRPRLCRLKILPNFSGYGFSLRTEAVGNVQNIEKVEKGSPAELGGLLSGDLLWTVNGKTVRKYITYQKN